MKFSILQKLLFLSLLILAGNLVLGYKLYRSNQKLVISGSWVDHTEQVIAQSVKIYSTVKDIETSSRGFVITKDSSYLGPLNTSGKTALAYIDQLKQLTRDNPSQQIRIGVLDFYVKKLLLFSNKAVSLRSDEGLANAVSYISGQQGKYYTDKILQSTNEIQQAEYILLKQRKQVDNSNSVVYHQYSLTIFILMAVFTVLLLMATGNYLFHNKEKRKREAELVIANKELLFQNDEKEKRAAELVIVNNELSYQNDEKEKRAAELAIANKELSYQNDEKEKRAAELLIANKELVVASGEKEQRAEELLTVNEMLSFRNKERERRAADLVIANKELSFQNSEKEKRAAELVIANKELSYQNKEKEKRAAELVMANVELFYQNEEKESRAAELIIANKELVYQNTEKENRAAELIIANKELSFQNDEKEQRAAELVIANVELFYQNKEKEERAAELAITNRELTFQIDERKTAEAERLKMLNDLVMRNKDLEQFAYIISHNLRAPIANIIGASNALEDEDLTIADKETLNSGISKSITKLDDVVQDLNHILEVKGGVNEHKQMVSFSELVDEIKSGIKHNCKITYDFSRVDEMFTLKPYLHSIFYNLISNSVKYRRQNVTCAIEIKSSKIKNGIKLIFTDNGMGIDLEKYGEQIFGLYKRFHPAIEGKGMGLYMVKTQVETLGGKINIKSKENEGAEFIIEFEV